MNTILQKGTPLPLQIWNSCYSYGYAMNIISSIKYHFSSQTELNNCFETLIQTIFFFQGSDRLRQIQTGYLYLHASVPFLL